MKGLRLLIMRLFKVHSPSAMSFTYDYYNDEERYV
jgi:hypothetical protein